MKISVIIPTYNEQATIYDIKQKVSSVQLIGGIGKELVVVNNFSKDSTKTELERF